MVKRRRNSAQASVTFCTMRLPFTIQKRLLNSVGTCSTPAPWSSLSWASAITSLVTGWSFSSRIGCLVSYGSSSAKRKCPSIRINPSPSVLGFNWISDPLFSPPGKAWACLIQNVSASDISVGRKIRSFLCKFIGSLQLVRNRWTHPVTWARRLRLENLFGSMITVAWQQMVWTHGFDCGSSTTHSLSQSRRWFCPPRSLSGYSGLVDLKGQHP